MEILLRVRQDPGVHHHLVQWQAMQWIQHQKLWNQVGRRLRDMLRQLIVSLQDLLVRLVEGLREEGSMTHQQFIAQHSEAPEVDVLGVGLALYHFWRQIIDSATKRHAHRVGLMYGPAEVGDLQDAFVAQQKVLRLDVSVDDVPFV